MIVVLKWPSKGTNSSNRRRCYMVIFSFVMILEADRRYFSQVFLDLRDVHTSKKWCQPTVQRFANVGET